MLIWSIKARCIQGIDYLEESNGKLQAWEIKSNPQTREKIPLTFQKAYPDAATGILNPGNYEDFLLP